MLAIRARHRMVAVAYPGLAPFELAIVIEVFGLERPDLDVKTWYHLDVCAANPGHHPAVGGIGLHVAYGLERIELADTVIVPGWPVAEQVPPALADAVRRAHARGARIVSICSGAFVLAAAGVLDGRRAATHWLHADELAAAYPEVNVDRNVLYIDDKDILTSAGSAAGIDLCIHLLRIDHGARVANQVARRLVVPAHRDGGQSQFIAKPVHPDNDSRLHDLIGWMDGHLADPLTVKTVARRSHMSERNFTRRFRQATGQSFTEYLIERRVAASLELLETGGRTIDEIAEAVGFASAVTFRYHFRHAMGIPPSRYRQSFRAS